jgi:predicted secreted protein
MATETPVFGKTLTLRIGTPTPTVITNLTSNSLSDTTDTRETTTKQSGTHKEYLPAFQDKTLSFEGLTTHTPTSQGLEDLRAAKAAGTIVDWEWGTGVVGTPKLTGKGIITSLDEDAPYDGDVTFSGEIQNTGDPVSSTYA